MRAPVCGAEIWHTSGTVGSMVPSAAACDAALILHRTDANRLGRANDRKTVSSRVVLAGVERPGVGRGVDRECRHELDGARAVSRSRADTGARLLRLCADRGFVLYRRKLRRVTGDLPGERDRGAAPGPVGRR